MMLNVFLYNKFFIHNYLILIFMYLATGSSFKILSFSFRKGDNSVVLIVKGTIKCILEELHAEHMPVPTEYDLKKI